MKNAFALTKRDIHRVTSNAMAAIVVVGLVLIPAFFTWFNVYASWDPFANTKNLKIAVANTDLGYQSDLIPIRINVGEQVVSALRGSDDFDWVVTTEDEAIDGTKSGEYYAAIVLPTDFSADMLTFFSGDETVTDLQYYINQKRNALAPTITGQGTQGVLAQIDRAFVHTLSEVALGLITSMSDFLTSGDTQAVFHALAARAQAASDQLRAGAGTADMFTTLIGSSIPLVQSSMDLVEISRSAFEDASGSVHSSLQTAGDLQGALQGASDALKVGIDATIDGYQAVGEAATGLFNQAGKLTADQAVAFDAMAARIDVQINQYQQIRDTLAAQLGQDLPPAAAGALQETLAALDRVIASQTNARDWLTQAATDIRSGTADTQALAKEITSALDQAKSALVDAKGAYESGLKPKLDALIGTLSGINADIAGLGANLEGALDGLMGTSGGIDETLEEAQKSMGQVSTKLTQAADKVDKLQDALAQAATGQDLSNIEQLVGDDPTALAAAIVTPVKVDRIPVFPVVSFGAGMAPLYTALALWVGALLTTVTINAGVGRRPLPGRPDLTTTEKYLGRYGIFGAIGLLQSTLVTIGLEVIVRIQPAHPLLFIVAGWVTSLVFTLLMYTLVVSLGNAGKAVGVFLLVIQISGAGGAYPLPLLPHWFQAISPFLPATHAINAMRAAIAGTYHGDFWISIGWLLAFVPVALLVGLVLRRPLISHNKKLLAALESTKLM